MFRNVSVAIAACISQPAITRTLDRSEGGVKYRARIFRLSGTLFSCQKDRRSTVVSSTSARAQTLAGPGIAARKSMERAGRHTLSALCRTLS